MSKKCDECRRSMWRIFCAQGQDKRDTFITLNNKIWNVYSFGIHCFLVYRLYFIGHEIFLAKLNRIQLSQYITCSHKFIFLVLRLVFAESKYFSHLCYRLYKELVFLCHIFLQVLYFFVCVCKSMMLHLSFQSAESCLYPNKDKKWRHKTYLSWIKGFRSASGEVQ